MQRSITSTSSTLTLSVSSIAPPVTYNAEHIEMPICTSKTEASCITKSGLESTRTSHKSSYSKLRKIFHHGHGKQTSQNSQSHHNHKPTNSDQFFIKLHQQQTVSNVLNDVNVDELVLKDQRRIVWVSLLGLYNSWRQCPSIMMYSSIFLLPLKQKWIYAPLKYQQQIEKNIVGHISIFQGQYIISSLCLYR